ncbi:MAG TPA: DinB family protein [Vicinamibacteria bacterium]|nr:DinB family protein [Vicinamibacteria bacterium]
MTSEDIRTLYAYERWANRRVVAAARLLAAEDFTRSLGTSHDSVSGTLVHILAAKCFWLRLWRGESIEEVLRRDAEWEQARFADLTALEARWSVEDRDLQVFLEGLTDAQLKTRMAYQLDQGQPREFSLAHMMQHVVNHSSYHRGQVITLLRQLGQTPPATDFLEFLREPGSLCATEPRVRVFFYGSYMNRAVLAEVGLVPERLEVARLDGYDIRIAPRANLVASEGQSVHGVLAEATRAELARLYAHAKDVLGETYVPHSVHVHRLAGGSFPALCYIAPEMAPRAPEPAYVERILRGAREAGLPGAYLGRLESAAARE